MCVKDSEAGFRSCPVSRPTTRRALKLRLGFPCCVLSLRISFERVRRPLPLPLTNLIARRPHGRPDPTLLLECAYSSGASCFCPVVPLFLPTLPGVATAFEVMETVEGSRALRHLSLQRAVRYSIARIDMIYSSFADSQPRARSLLIV